MPRMTISLILAIIFIVAAFSRPMIPCSTEKTLDLCILEGEQDYFFTNKLSNPWIGGFVAFMIVFLIIFALTHLILPKKKLIMA